MRAILEENYSTGVDININYLDQYNNAIVSPEARGVANIIASKIIKNSERYKIVQRATDVPWAVIACLHYRESDLNFNCHLHNGDPLAARTRHEPKGRPIAPPVNGTRYTWEESAADALRYDGARLVTGLDGIPGWTLNEALYFFEKYNGFGYRKYHDMNSPYLWSGTDQYTVGKYASDGKFDKALKDKQLGVVPILKALSFQ